MSPTHKIMRMVLELADCQSEAAPELQAGLRQAHAERLLPAMDRICTALAGPDRVHRIARLELDLGPLSLHALQADLGERFEAAFTRQLSAALQDAPAVDADGELLNLFIASGSLPWWADPHDRGLVADSLRRLLARSALAPWQALAAAPDAARARRRLVRALPDAALNAWLAPRLPDAPAAAGAAAGRDPAAWLAPLAAASAGLALDPLALRHLWWEALLPLADPAAAPAPADWPAQALRQLAAALGLAWPELIRALEQAAVSAPASVRDGLQRLAQQAANASAGAATAPDAATAAALARAALARLLAELAGAASPVQDFWPRLRAALEALPTARAEAACDALAQACASGPPQEAAERRALARRLRGLAGQDAPFAAADADGAVRDDAAASASRSPEPVAAARGFSQADEVYVHNAGLVILWPFLPAFLARLGLVHERRFVDAAAAHRAAGLLQALASGEQDPPEALLPLNKLLCGLAADAVFDFGPPLTEAEADECQGLLGAVIQQAPILRDMSIAGFRGSFLLRRGQLSAQGDHWLLRVERETHDIVLERFPWGFNPVKLPWMRALLQVEW